ncbi:MAG: sulfatase [Gammaproteobacteria bacterium]|nr:MAG: sulfatase [Gammaproteobacteria bacterium]
MKSILRDFAEKYVCVITLMAVIATLTTACAPDTPTATQDTRPNILFIMSDDHSERAISAYGSTLINTPNIDRIADEGVIFRESFVANSICGPSRAIMLTGKHSHKNGFRDNDDRFDASQPTYPLYLQQAGYATAVVGKWHLGTKPVGFDYWEVLRGQGQYYSPEFITNIASDMTTEKVVKDEPGEVVEVELENRYEGEYVTTKIADLALDFLGTRDESKPFLLIYNHKAPHRNWMPDVDELGEIDTSDLEVPENFYDDYAGRPGAAAQALEINDMYLSYDLKLEQHEYEGDLENMADGWAEYWTSKFYARMSEEQKAGWDAYYTEANKEYQSVKHDAKALLEWKYRRYMHEYLGTVHSMDRNIGRVLDYLDENGLAENTIVVYTSDQGFYIGEHGWFDKRYMYEESMRTPLMVRYPAGIEAGQTVSEMVQNIDYAPTLLDFAGVPVPADMQGLSLKGMLTGVAQGLDRENLYYHYYEGIEKTHNVARQYGVRTRTYKLIRFKDVGMDHWEMYDLQQDPGEMRNIYDDPSYAEIRRDLRQKLQELRTKYDDSSGEQI